MPTTTIAAIDRQLDFRASPERLWRALTEDGELASWFGQRAQLDLRAGGDGWLEFEGYGRVPVRIDVFEPVTRLSWRWGDAGKSVDEGSTLVEFRLEPLAGGGTRLHLRESGFEREDSRWSNTEGWVTELAELARHVAVEPFEAGIRRTYALTSPLDRVWRAFSEPAELGAWWAGTPDLEIRPGYEGWFVWPSEGGRFAMRFEAVEPPRYLCWTWTPVPDVPLARGDDRAADRVDARPARGRWDRPPPVRERLHRAHRLRHEQRRLGRRHPAGAPPTPRRGVLTAAQSFAPGRRGSPRVGRAHPPSVWPSDGPRPTGNRVRYHPGEWYHASGSGFRPVSPPLTTPGSG